MNINVNKKVLISDIKPHTDIKIENIYVKNHDIKEALEEIQKIKEMKKTDDYIEVYIDDSNLLKREKRFFKCLNIKIEENYKINNQYIFPLEEASLFIAYCYFPTSKKDTISYKIYNGELNTISGNQYLAFLALASDVSIYLKNKKINPFESRFDKLPQIENFDYTKQQFIYKSFPENSERFQRQAMYGKLKAQTQELVNSFFISQYPNSFPQNSTSESSDIFEALSPFHIEAEPEKLTEEKFNMKCNEYLDNFFDYIKSGLCVNY